jgi:hypothetical protein
MPCGSIKFKVRGSKFKVQGFWFEGAVGGRAGEFVLLKLLSSPPVFIFVP